MAVAFKILLALATLCLVIAGNVRVFELGASHFGETHGALIPIFAALVAMGVELAALVRLTRTPASWNPGCLGQQLMLIGLLAIVGGSSLRNALGLDSIMAELQWELPGWSLLVGGVVFMVCELYLAEAFFADESPTSSRWNAFTRLFCCRR